jgi:hypothetical protein
MKVERFLNHIYYSFAAFDRMFSFSSLEYRDGNDMDIIASKLMGLSIVGYLTGLLYVLILLPIRMLGVHIIKLKAFLLIAPFLLVGLSLLLSKFFATSVYTRYFKEFREDQNYDSLLWNMIAVLFFVGGVSIFLYTVFHI